MFSNRRLGRVVWGLCLSVCLSLAAPSLWAAEEADWPCFRGPNHDGKSPDKGLLKSWPKEGPELLWKATGIGKGFSSAAVSDGMVYVTGDVGPRLVLFAFDMDGKLKWQTPVEQASTQDPRGARATPTVDAGKVYLLGAHGAVACFNAKTGKKVWASEAGKFGGSPGGWGYAESILIDGNLAIFKPGGANCIVAVNKLTGQPVWGSKGFSAGPEYGSCFPFTFGGAQMIVTGTNQGIVCVAAKTGRQMWANDFSAGNTANCPTPVFSDGYVFWANGYGKGGICLKLAGAAGRITAKEAWTTSNMDCHHGGFIIHEGYIYGNNGGGWACLDLKTGKVQWNKDGVGKGSLCYADGLLFLFSESNGRAGLAACTPEGLELKGTFQVKGSGPSWAHPVVIGGRLYLRYDDNLYCFDVKAK